jgi:hypothetical protein
VYGTKYSVKIKYIIFIFKEDPAVKEANNAERDIRILSPNIAPLVVSFA